MEHREETVFVTGASSGIGNACATYLAKKGYRTYGAFREPAKFKKKADEYFDLVQMDIADDASVSKAAEALLSKEGRIDHLVCCAGTFLVGSIEDCTIEAARRQLEIDYFGTLRTIKAFLPSMREAGTGRIVVSSSMIALVGLPFIAHYSAAKRGLEALVDSLRRETEKFGIEACILEIGPFRTSLTEPELTSEDEDSPYRDAQEAFIKNGQRREEAGEGIIPLEAAKAVHALLRAKRMPARKSVGPLGLRSAVFAKRLLPPSLYEFIVRNTFHT
jgi:NAD(P)-dependent dehydrogenase (short-subunit alcohol dehydrogenase family)